MHYTGFSTNSNLPSQPLYPCWFRWAYSNSANSCHWQLKVERAAADERKEKGSGQGRLKMEVMGVIYSDEFNGGISSALKCLPSSLLLLTHPLTLQAKRQWRWPQISSSTSYHSCSSMDGDLCAFRSEVRCDESHPLHPKYMVHSLGIKTETPH